MNKYAMFSKAKEKQKEYHKRQGCEGKKKFESFDEAYQKGATIYKCPFCGGFHRSFSASKFAAKLRRRK